MTRIVRLGKLSCAFAAPRKMTRPNNAPAVLPRRLVITPRALPCWRRFRGAMGSQDAGNQLMEQDFATRAAHARLMRFPVRTIRRHSRLPAESEAGGRRSAWLPRASR